jgi:hypothetical protein
VICRTSHGDAYDLWDAATGLLRESPARPELRRALWEIIATIPGELDACPRLSSPGSLCECCALVM